MPSCLFLCQHWAISSLAFSFCVCQEGEQIRRCGRITDFWLLRSRLGLKGGGTQNFICFLPCWVKSTCPCQHSVYPLALSPTNASLKSSHFSGREAFSAAPAMHCQVYYCACKGLMDKYTSMWGTALTPWGEGLPVAVWRFCDVFTELKLQEGIILLARRQDMTLILCAMYTCV